MKVSFKKGKNSTAMVAVEINKEDYQNKVAETLKTYQKKAAVKGFRKGHAPLSLIKSQYEGAIVYDEVIKLVQSELFKYLRDNEIAYFGSPLPKEDNKIDPKVSQFKLEFELGLLPEFKVAYKSKDKLNKYHITASEKMINEQIERYQNQFAKIKEGKHIQEESILSGTFILNDEEKGTAFHCKTLTPKTFEAIKGMKPEDTVSLDTNLFLEVSAYEHFLGIKQEEVDKLDKLTFTLKSIQEREPHELDKAFYQKILGEDTKITTEDGFRKHLKNEIELSFKPSAESHFYNDAIEGLLSKNSMKLPEDFLKRLVQKTAEKKISEEDVEKQYEHSEKSIRYQVLTDRILKDHNIKISQEDINATAKKTMALRLKQYGMPNPTEDIVEGLVQKSLENEEQIREFNEIIKQEKITEILTEKLKFKAQTISYEDYLKLLEDKKNAKK